MRSPCRPPLGVLSTEAGSEARCEPRVAHGPLTQKDPDKSLRPHGPPGGHVWETYTRRVALVRPDSPLRTRSDIDARQAAQLDAIAFSANVIDFLYRRLAAFLLSVGTTRPITAEEVLADAWAIIDWVHRLDGLVRNLRGLPKGSVVVQDLLNATSLVETQRHRLQHLEGTIPAIEATGRSAFGHLCWTLDGGPTDDSGREQIIACTIPFSRGQGEMSWRLPHVLPPRGPIDYISLFSADGEAEIGLTGQAEALVRFIACLEAAVASAGDPRPNGILAIPI